MARIFSRFNQQGQPVQANFPQLQFAGWDPNLDAAASQGDPLGKLIGSLGGGLLGKAMGGDEGGGPGEHEGGNPLAKLAKLAGSEDADRTVLPVPVGQPSGGVPLPQPVQQPAPVQQQAPMQTFAPPPTADQWGTAPAPGIGAMTEDPLKKKENTEPLVTSLDNKTAEESISFENGQPMATRPRVVPGENPSEWDKLSGDGGTYPTPPNAYEESGTTPYEEGLKKPEPELTGSAKYRKELEDLEKTPPKERKGKFRRFGSGVRDAVMGLVEAGVPLTLENIAGAALSGGIGSVFSPGMNAEMTRDRKKGKIMRKYGEARALESEEAKRKSEMAKAQGEVFEAQTKGVKLQQLVADPYIQTLLKQEQITPEQSEYIKKTYGLDVPQASWRKFKNEVRNGVTYTGSEYDPRYRENKTLPEEIGETWRDAKIGKSTVPVQTKQIAPLIQSVENANAQRAQQESQYVRTDERQRAEFNAQQLQKAQTENANNSLAYSTKIWQDVKTQAALKGENIANAQEAEAIAAEMQRIAGQMQTIDPDTKRYDELVDQFNKAQVSFTKALSKSTTGQEMLKTVEANRPPAPQRITPQTIGKGQTTQPAGGKKVTTKAMVEKYAKENGLTYKQAEAKAIADEYEIK
jgi:hypothetical protein